MRLVILISGFRRANKRKKAGYIFAAVGLLVFLGFILFLSIMLLQFLRSPALAEYVSDMTPFLEAFPTMMVSVSTLGILMTGFGVLLQALYLSGDMDFLMSAPIPVRAVFIAKLVQAVLPNFGLMCLFTLPILFGLGISGGYNILYYPMVLVVLVLLSLAAASLASLLVMTAARFFPARRMAEVLGFVVGTFIFIFSQSASFVAGMSQFKEGVEGVSHDVQLPVYGIRVLGPDVILSGPIVDFGLLLHYGAPSYYAQASSTTPNGFLIWTEALLMMPIRMRETSWLGVGAGPVLAMSNIQTTRGLETNDSFDARIGVTLSFTGAIRFDEFLVRGDLRYVWAGESYPQATLGIGTVF